MCRCSCWASIAGTILGIYFYKYVGQLKKQQVRTGLRLVSISLTYPEVVVTGEQLCEVQGPVWDQLGREEEQDSGDLVAAVSLECLSSALGERSRGNREYLATCWSAEGKKT